MTKLAVSADFLRVQALTRFPLSLFFFLSLLLWQRSLSAACHRRDCHAHTHNHTQAGRNESFFLSRKKKELANVSVDNPAAKATARRLSEGWLSAIDCVALWLLAYLLLNPHQLNPFDCCQLPASLSFVRMPSC